MNEDMQEFIEQLGSQPSDTSPQRPAAECAPCPSPAETAESDAQQWKIGSNGTFIPCGKTTPRIPAGVYGIEEHPNIGLYFRARNVISDDLLRLPDSKGDLVLQSIQHFWERENVFRQYRQIFKRGILLYGPPGSGKTSVLALLMRDLIQRGGIVIIADTYPPMIRHGLALLRQIEPDRPLITVFEDIDELCRRYAEAELLSIFDGEGQVDKVCHLATTNYPQFLDERFINRPSRFDEVIKIGMPSAAARRTYLASKNALTEANIKQWVADTEGFSIAHLRELFVSVVCLETSYNTVLSRLRTMQHPPKSARDTKVGFEK